MKNALALVALAWVAVLPAQQINQAESSGERTTAAMHALDRYLETWNSRDARQWASSLHFPHINGGSVEIVD